MDVQEEMKLNDDFFDELSGEKGPDLPKETTNEIVDDNKISDSDAKQDVVDTPDDNSRKEPASSEFNIKDYFPEYESVDQVKEVLERAKSLPKDDEINDLRQKAESYSKHNEFIETLRSAGLNKDYLRLNALESQKSEKSDVYKRLLFGELTDTELIKLDLIDKYPELKDDKEMLEFQLEEKYPHIFGEDADPESEDFAKAKKKMRFEATQVQKRLKGEFESIELPDSLDPDSGKKKMQQTLETWKNNFESHADELTTINVDVDGEKFTDIKIPDNQIKEYKNAALMFLAQNGLRYSKESLQKAKDYVKGLYIANNLASYNKAILNKQEQMLNDKWRKGIHNPEPVDKSKKPVEKADDFVRFLDELNS